MSKLLIAGVDVLPHDGKVVFVNQDGQAMFKLSIEASEILLTRLANAISQIKDGKIIIPLS